MLTNMEISKFFIKAKMQSKLFGGEISALIRKDADLDYAEKCAEAFDNMPDDLLDQLCDLSVRYCKSHAIYSDSEPVDVGQGRDVLRHITLMSFNVQRPLDDRVCAYSLEFDCEWEAENGMEWSIRDNKALYVGPFINAGAQKHIEFYEKCSPNYVYDRDYM